MLDNYLAKSPTGNTCFCDHACKCHWRNQVSEGESGGGEGSDYSKEQTLGQCSGV